jgi:hypothetical protein
VISVLILKERASFNHHPEEPAKQVVSKDEGDGSG